MTSPKPSAAVGFSVHTGWAAAVVVTRPPLSVLARRKLELAENSHDARFVYHVAQERPTHADHILMQAESTARERATACLRELSRELSDYALLVALPNPKRALPTTSAILASHPLIHSAEGALFRRAIADAATSLGIPVAIVHPRAVPLMSKLGPPWGKDQKNAAALAWAALEASEPRE
jgi:hypothetical protein